MRVSRKKRYYCDDSNSDAVMRMIQGGKVASCGQVSGLTVLAMRRGCSLPGGQTQPSVQ